MKIHEATLSYRVLSEGQPTALDEPEAVVRYMQGAFDNDPTVEWFFVVLLNRKNYPLGRTAITKGIANSCLVHPREVFRPAILAGASAIICVHNHPSGITDPSRQDINVTRQLRQSGETLGIELLDHVIIGDPGYYSFKDSGFL